MASAFLAADARAPVYGLLARLFLGEVDATLAKEMSQPEFVIAFGGAGGELPADQSDDLLEEWAIDYCRLFVGPTDHLPPLQSVWEEGQLQAASAASMQSFIEVVNYDSARLPRGVMLDHLGVQLDLMAVLLLEDPGGDSAQVLDEVVRAFFAAHLCWTDAFLSEAVQRANTAFYRSVTAMTAEFLETEALFFRSLGA